MYIPIPDLMMKMRATNIITIIRREMSRVIIHGLIHCIKDNDKIDHILNTHPTQHGLEQYFVK